MNISVIGLGYVGLVTSACLARDGANVIGVDVDEAKVKAVAEGRSHVVESGLAGLIAMASREGRLRATTDIAQAIQESDVTLICVGTPSRPDGTQDLKYVEACCDSLGEAIRVKKKPHVVVMRSTVMPGTTDALALRMQEKAGSTSIYTAFNPEFLREGSAISDYDNPPFVVAGTVDVRAESVLREIYTRIPSPFIRTSAKTAEVIKLACNAWHATKIAFANEMGRIGDSLDIDSREVMGILCRDTKLNISHAYLMPGFAYGGSCLPKDVRALIGYGNEADVNLPLLQSLSQSNDAQIDWAVRQIVALDEKKVGLLGLAFKAGTDDLRESPAITLSMRLLAEGFDLKILDPCMRPSTISEANQAFLKDTYPELLPLLANNDDDIVEHARAIVLTQGTTQLADVVAKTRREIPIVDLSKAFLRRPKRAPGDEPA